MPPRYDLDLIVGLLDRHHQRATYGALGALLGVLAVAVMKGRPRTPENSWVVNGVTLRASGYVGNEIHPALFEKTTVLKSEEELVAWLSARS